MPEHTRTPEGHTLKVHQDTDRPKPTRPCDFDPGLLIVDSFLNEEQEERILDEITKELEGSGGPEEPTQSRSSLPSSCTTSVFRLLQITHRRFLSDRIRDLARFSADKSQSILCFNNFVA